MGISSTATKASQGVKITQRTENNTAIVQLAINKTNLSMSTFHRILKQCIGLYPHKRQIKHEVQVTTYINYARMRAFCSWFISKYQSFTEKLIETDEAAFSMNGKVYSLFSSFSSSRRFLGFLPGPMDVWLYVNPPPKLFENLLPSAVLPSGKSSAYMHKTIMFHKQSSSTKELILYNLYCPGRHLQYIFKWM